MDKELAGSDSVMLSFILCLYVAVPVALKISKGTIPLTEGKGEGTRTLPSTPSRDINWMYNVIGMAGCFSFWGPMFLVLQDFSHPFHNPIRQVHTDPIVKTLKLRTEGNEMPKVPWRGHRAVLPDFSPRAQRHVGLLVSGCQSCVPLKTRCPGQLLLQSNEVALGQQGEQEGTSETQHSQLRFLSQGPGSRHFSK